MREDEEIQVKGTAVFPKYHKNEEASEDSFTEDGWYRTGDLGRIDDDGFLYIIGRKKDLIITAGGKNVSPGPIEEAIKRCEFRFSHTRRGIPTSMAGKQGSGP